MTKVNTKPNFFFSPQFCSLVNSKWPNETDAKDFGEQKSLSYTRHGKLGEMVMSDSVT